MRPSGGPKTMPEAPFGHTSHHRTRGLPRAPKRFIREFLEGKFSGFRPNEVLGISARRGSPLPNSPSVHPQPTSRATTINPMPSVGTFHTSERISGTPAA